MKIIINIFRWIKKKIINLFKGIPMIRRIKTQRRARNILKNRFCEKFSKIEFEKIEMRISYWRRYFWDLYISKKSLKKLEELVNQELKT